MEIRRNNVAFINELGASIATRKDDNRKWQYRTEQEKAYGQNQVTGVPSVRPSCFLVNKTQKNLISVKNVT
jgi:hypothetical protein